MERLILLSQAASLSVIFYIVTYFLTCWHWPETVLSIFLSALFLYYARRIGPVCRPNSNGPIFATAPDLYSRQLVYMVCIS